MSDLKIVLLGSSGAGKTCLVQRLVTGKFNQKEQSTMGASFLQKSYKSRTGETFEFAIWDTAGQERFDSLSTFYTRDAGCAIIVYDMTSNNSFRDLDRMFPKLESASQGCFVILVGSKVDIVKEDQKKRKVSFENGLQIAKKYQATFFESSSKTGENTDEIWEKIGEQFVKAKTKKKKKEINKENEPQDNNIIKIDQPSDNETEKKKEKKKRKEDGGGCC
ncbi:ras family-domain-containing protein [Anaeramoeba flamelloides]|uniref:Ras family-domain-containing protein n=1 Tax=Anaeramoeba flamelloides TaxID=1746091 RepID=A0AAV7Z611_9EUKA|nr:ras family-domain-containing protein [Anaeramoeba flamelloides]KAJ6226034.1 ras family-domain-containing protein [Anaeramoeba flamelloides]